MHARLRIALHAVVVVGFSTACKRDAPIASCAADLHGAWRSETGPRWMVLDNRSTLEMYPMFDDSKPSGMPPGPGMEGPGFTPGLEIAPRVIDLARSGNGLAGDVRRRFTQRGTTCVATAPAHVTSCADASIEIVLADPPAPIEFDPCSYPRPDSSRRERWHRE